MKRGHMSAQKPKETRHPVIAVEGAIGAGKSTFLRWVRAEYAADGHVVGDEYVSHLMPRYYSNERRWALPPAISGGSVRSREATASPRMAVSAGR